MTEATTAVAPVEENSMEDVRQLTTTTPPTMRAQREHQQRLNQERWSSAPVGRAQWRRCRFESTSGMFFRKRKRKSAWSSRSSESQVCGVMSAPTTSSCLTTTSVAIRAAVVIVLIAAAAATSIIAASQTVSAAEPDLSGSLPIADRGATTSCNVDEKQQQQQQQQQKRSADQILFVAAASSSSSPGAAPQLGGQPTPLPLPPAANNNNDGEENKNNNNDAGRSDGGAVHVRVASAAESFVAVDSLGAIASSAQRNQKQYRQTAAVGKWREAKQEQAKSRRPPLTAPLVASSRRKRRSVHQKGAESASRVVAVSGQWVELQCPLASELLGQPDHSISWRKNGAPLNQLSPRQKVNALNGSLILVGAQPKLDDAVYECDLVRAAAGGTDQHQPAPEEPLKSHRFELKLIVPPSVAPFEFPASAQVGMKVVLTCSILEGQQPVSFVWLKDNQIIIGADHHFHHHSGVGMQQQQQQSSSSSSSSSSPALASSATLAQLHQQQLADKYALSAQPSSVAFSGLGQRAEYVIIGDKSSGGQESGGGGGAGAQQPQQLLPVLSDSNIRIRQADDYSILSIDKLELKHSGRYTCSVQNEAARTSHSSQLLINAPPTFTVEPKDSDLVSGQSTVIDCAASGQPRPTISWLRARESSSTKQWDYVPVYDNLRYTTLPNGSLAVANVTQREQGYYLCSAKNGFGPEMTKLIKITVHEPARFDTKYKTVEVRIEERANMVCMASGEQPISIEWLDKAGNTIQRSDKKFIIDNDPADIRPSEPANETVSRLILARSGRSDSGHYTCQAANKHGSDKMVTNLLVQDVPDKVTELKVTNATSTTISIRWQLAFSGNSPVTSYLVQYQSDDPIDDLLLGPPLPGGSQTPSQRQAAAAQAAAAAVAAATGQNEAQLGADQPNDPTGLLMAAATGAGSGQPLQQQQPGSSTSSLKAALEALNVASNLESADEAIDRTLVELTVEQSSTHLVVKDLSPYCVYRLRLAAINKIGLGEFSDWIRAKTEEAPPGGSASKIQASATGPNSIKLTWSPPDRRSWNGQLIGFNIGYRPIDSSFELNKTIEWTPPTLQSIMIDSADSSRQQQRGQQATTKPSIGLHPHLQTIVSALGAAYQQSTTTNSGGQQQQQLGKDRPVSGISGGNQSNGSASSSADLSSGTAGSAASSSQYLLRQHLRQLLASQQQELVAHLTNLQRSTTYLVWIQAVNNRGFGTQSHAISVKTLDDVPPSAPAIKIQSTSLSSITIAWSMLSNFVSSANQYSLFYRRVPQPSGVGGVISPSAAATTSSAGHAPATMRTNLTNSADQLGGPAAEVDSGGQLAGSQRPTGPLFEPGPFIERTISSQQLMMSANSPGLFLSADQAELIEQQQQHHQHHLKGTTFMHQQSQHYQQFVYTLDQLECGSVYELYMTTRNSVGKSEPSTVVTTRTLGEPPLAPANKNSLFAKIGHNDVVLNLAAWSTGGCPLTDITVRYKQAPKPVAALSSSASNSSSSSSSFASSSPPASSLLEVSWPMSTRVPANLLAAVNNQQLLQATTTRGTYSAGGDIGGQQHGHKPTLEGPLSSPLNSIQPIYTLKNLAPSSCYELEIVARNTAGHTMAQYEFVTSNLNGTRGGYSRKEGVFRIDQRGFPIDQLADSSRTNEQQQASFGTSANQSQFGASGSQLIPMILVSLCFVCLIVSSGFCYYRLTDSWKHHRQRRSSSDTSATAGSRSLHGGGCQPSNLSPGSIGKSSMWRLNGGHSTLLKQQQPPHHHHHHYGSRDTGQQQSDSPMHYCMRDPGLGANNHQQLMSATLQAKKASTFSQSVSMKDFNLVAQGSGDGPQSHTSAPLGFKTYRGVQPTALVDHNGGSGGIKGLVGGTLRNPRLLSQPTSEPNNPYDLNRATNYATSATLGHPTCSIYAAACKQQQQQKQQEHHSQDTYLAAANNGAQHQQHDSATNGGVGMFAVQGQVSSADQYDNAHHQCSSYSAHDGQQQETSWTTTAGNNYAGNTNNGGIQQQQFGTASKHTATTYAIPTANYGTVEGSQSAGVATYDSNADQIEYQQDGYGHIDACIQQLMTQQYQQQQQQQQQHHEQQQQYAMIMNQKLEPNARCLYGGEGFLGGALQNSNHQNNNNGIHGVQAKVTGLQTTINCSQSLIDSSSSSSGIDLGTHLDCASSTATGTSNSNTSTNNGYQLNGHQPCESDFNNNDNSHQAEQSFPRPPAAQTMLNENTEQI